MKVKVSKLSKTWCILFSSVCNSCHCLAAFPHFSCFSPHSSETQTPNFPNKGRLQIHVKSDVLCSATAAISPLLILLNIVPFIFFFFCSHLPFLSAVPCTLKGVLTSTMTGKMCREMIQKSCSDISEIFWKFCCRITYVTFCHKYKLLQLIS